MKLFQRILLPFLPAKMRIMIKASQLAEQGKTDLVFHLFEKQLGITALERNDPGLLRIKIEGWLTQHGRKDINMMFVAQYASSFGLIRANASSLAVLEAALQLEQADYNDTIKLAGKLDQNFLGLQEETRLLFWIGLHGVLSIVGRSSEAMDIFKYDLGILNIESNEDEGKELILGKIYSKLGSLSNELRGVSLTFLFPLFNDLGLQKEGLDLFEYIVGISPDDYGEPELLAQKISYWIDGLQNSLNGKFAILGLMGTLYQAEEAAKALILVEAFFGIKPEDYHQVDLLSKKWKNGRDSLPEDTAATFYRMFISMLETSGRNPPLEVKALVQADCGLRDEDFKSFEMVGEKLSRRGCNSNCRKTI